MTDLKKVLVMGLEISLVLSVVVVVIGFLTKPAPARYQDIVIGAANAVILAFGLYRIRTKSDEKSMGTIASQHLWIVFSLSTAVLSLLFGSYFYPGSASISYANMAIMSLISVVTLVAVVSAAAKKVPIFD